MHQQKFLHLTAKTAPHAIIIIVKRVAEADIKDVKTFYSHLNFHLPLSTYSSSEVQDFFTAFIKLKYLIVSNLELNCHVVLQFRVLTDLNSHLAY